ncbi:SRPBCC domain-containing protein [Microbispora sp. H10670]|uniref:SRPBCC domain-containing protein n=1 Tax=Microbispora sp. H10670 TaxID=2729108 RepID=UPI002175EE2B|nr:SRPBCC domain-containing protein [Microbispora sp. H10670]
MIENPTTITAQPGSPFIEVVREFDAPPARLFRAYTDPELVTRWLGPRDIEMRLIEYDARPGGAYRYVHRDVEGNEHVFRGVFHTVTPGERIVQILRARGHARCRQPRLGDVRGPRGTHPAVDPVRVPDRRGP